MLTSDRPADDTDTQLEIEEVAPAVSEIAPETGMPQISYLVDERTGKGDNLEDAADVTAGRQVPLRLRVSIALWDPAKGQYLSWKGQTWKMDLPGPDRIAQAKAFRAALEEFFDVLAREGADGTVSRLKR